MFADDPLFQEGDAQPLHKVQQRKTAFLFVWVINTKNGTDHRCGCVFDVFPCNDLMDNIRRFLLCRFAVRQTHTVNRHGLGLGQLFVILLLGHRQDQVFCGFNGSLLQCV